MTAEELHLKYRADLAEAKEKDRAESGLLFLDITVEVGKFELAPLTVRRYLILEQLKSPFLLAGEKMPDKQDIINFLWVMNPDFKIGMKYGKRFARRNFIYFIRWQKLAVELAETLKEALEKSQLPTGSQDQAEEPDKNWVATLVDAAASQYGWSEKDILDLPLTRVFAYVEAVGRRLGGEKATWAKHADKVRADYLRTLNDLAVKNKKGESE